VPSKIEGCEEIRRAEVVICVPNEIKKTIFRKAMETSPLIGEVRGKGFMLSVEIIKNKETREPEDGEKVLGLVTEMIIKGILNFICGRYGNAFRFVPPLTTQRPISKKAAEIFPRPAQGERKGADGAADAQWRPCGRGVV
jgi:adenosylmethionine-8-amino-7-oxononanoate aminotransferase